MKSSILERQEDRCLGASELGLLREQAINSTLLGHREPVGWRGLAGAGEGRL